MKRLHSLLLAVALLLSACSAEESTADFPQGNIPIGFSGDVLATRATEYASAANLTAIGVFAYFTNGEFAEANATSNFMYNQPVNQSDGTWTYSPVRYWPNNNTDRLSFFAYAPYVDEAVAGGSNPVFKGKVETGFPTLTYTVPSAEANQTDLLAAVPLMNNSYQANNGTVKFQLKHALTKVSVYVKSNDDVAGKKVTAFSIAGVKSGTLTYHSPTDITDKGSSWSYPAPDVTETFTATTTDFAVPNLHSADKQLLATFFLLPRGDGNTFSITYTTPGITSDGTRTIMQTITLTGQPLPSPETWTQGTAVSYTIGIEKKKIIVKAATHSEWSDGGEGTVTGNVTITYAISPADPDWSDGGEGIVTGNVTITYAVDPTDTDWGNGGTVTVNGQAITTYTEQNTPPAWNEGVSETVDGTEKTN